MTHMPLEHTASNAARSRNIGRLRRDGYPPKQAAAIAYKEQRNAMARRSLARRRGVGLARSRRNPSSPIGAAIGALTLGGLIGAGLGAVVAPPAATGALTGAQSGVGVTGLGGLLVGIFSERNRMAGLTTAGIGLGGLALLGLAQTLLAASKPTTTTT